MRQNFLKRKIASLVIWAGLLSALVIGGVVFWYLYQFSAADQQEQIVGETIAQAQQSALIFKNNQLFVKMIGTRPQVKDFLLQPSEAGQEELLTIFSRYAQENKKYLAVYLLDKDGVALVSTDARFVGQNYSFRDYFQGALQGSPVVEAALGKTSQQFGYYFSHPVSDDQGAVLGVMVVKVDVNDIESYLFSGPAAEKGTVMLTNKFGIVVASNQPDRVLKSLGPLSELELAEIKREESFPGRDIAPLQYNVIQQFIRDYRGLQIVNIYDQEDNTRETLSVAKIAGLPFYLVVENRLGSIASRALVTVAIIFSVILIGLVAELFVIYYFLSIFLRPLKKIHEFSKSIGGGDFSQTIDIKTNDEFGELADSFNKMGANLHDLYRNLDDKVLAKTKDVDRKAKQLADQKKAILNVLEDAEAQKERAENLAKDLEKFKLAVDNASDQVIIADRDGTILFANRAVEDVTGFKPEEVVGKKVGTKDLWGGEMDKSFYAKLWKTVKIDKQSFNGEIHNHRKDGEKYIAKTSISPILDKAGEVVFFVAIERDITKEKMIDQAKSDFISLASHQLRTPLSAMKWTMEAFAGDQSLTAKHQERLRDLYVSNERLIALVNDLLNVSHIADKKLTVKKQVVDIVKAVKNLVETIKINADKKQQLLKMNTDIEAASVSLDIVLLGETFTNLVSNAINYAPAGARIDITLSVSGQNYLIAVHNDEPIIPLADQAKLFTKFYRGINGQAANTAGTGLGLFIAKAAAEANGGKIWFESRAGVGTTFYFTVPKK